MSCVISQQQIISELISTERSYVKDLQEICEVYLPCFGLLHNISKEDIGTVFNNIASILNLSRKLLEELVSADGNLAKIAESFLNRASDFHQYTTYCTCYHRANERLFEVRQQNPVVATILLDVQRSLGHALPLSSYLHKPVQRILKYHLILKNLLKSVEEDNESKAYLFEAHECMASCAEQINNSKRLTEMDVKTRELHELLLTLRENAHFGKLIREGEMTVEIRGCSPSAGKTMFIYLFENVLVLCHKLSGSFALHTILRCSELVILEDNQRREIEFTVMPFSTPSQTLTIRAKTLAQKLDWCIQLHKLTDHNIPNKAKKLLLSNNNSLIESAKESYSKQHKRRAHFSALSPSLIGKTVKTHIRSGVSGMLTKSKSTINLRRSSSSTSGGSSGFYKNYDSAFDSTSLKSDVSSSSDQLSTISATNSSTSNTATQQQLQCYDDLSPHASSLHRELTRGAISNWHHQIVLRINSFQHPDLSEDLQSNVRKAKSCVDLTTPSGSLSSESSDFHNSQSGRDKRALSSSVKEESHKVVNSSNQEKFV